MKRAQRSEQERLTRLAWILAGIAGAVNAGGFMAVQAYTSHVTGSLSRAADDLALGRWNPALAALSVVLAFFLGALTSGSMVAYAQRRRIHGHYAASLALEAALLTLFGLGGPRLAGSALMGVPDTILLLSFIMGMHNALVTQVSHAVVRTTHMTGIVTDLGLELSRLFYRNRSRDPRLQPVLADRAKLRLHALLLLSFFGGGVAGALAFNSASYPAALPLAALMLALSARPLWRDLRVRWRLWQRRS